jgi:DNA-binding response OmpR family regulator
MNSFVMVIDDSPIVRNILEVYLARAGYHVQSFQDGDEAMQWLLSPHACPPGLVFLDSVLPNMDGFEVAKHFKAIPQLQDTVIVMLSGRDGDIEHHKIRPAGATGYVAKPFQMQNILAAAATHLGVPAPSEHADGIGSKAQTTDT